MSRRSRYEISHKLAVELELDIQQMYLEVNPEPREHITEQDAAFLRSIGIAPYQYLAEPQQ